MGKRLDKLKTKLKRKGKGNGSKKKPKQPKDVPFIGIRRTKVKNKKCVEIYLARRLVRSWCQVSD